VKNTATRALGRGWLFVCQAYFPIY